MIETQARVSFDDFKSVAADAYGGLAALGKAVHDAGLEDRLTELVKICVSQINQCAFCLQLHLNVARRIGLEAEKIDLIPTWRDSGIFSDREYAALAWAEELTLLDEQPADEAWAALLREFSEKEALFLTVTIATINAWNRIGGPLRFAPSRPQRQGQR